MRILQSMKTTKARPGRKPSITGDVVRTSLKLQRAIWMEAHKLALERNTDLAVIVNDALLEYITGKGARAAVARGERAARALMREAAAAGLKGEPLPRRKGGRK
jgi:hypothetical protein